MGKKLLVPAFILIVTIITAIMAYVAFGPFKKTAQTIQRTFKASTQEDTSCFDFYQFQKINVSLSSLNKSENSFVPGEKVDFDALIKSDVDVSIAVFDVRYRLVKVQEDPQIAQRFGNDIFDEGILIKGINFKPKDTKQIQTSYRIPYFIPSGQYQLNTYVTQKDKFNWSGLYFTDDTLGSFLPLTIKSSQEPLPFFNRTATTVNGQPRNHIGFITQPHEKNTSSTIANTIANPRNQEIKGTLTNKLYYWDQQDETHLLQTTTDNITLEPNQKKELPFTIPNLEQPAYVLERTFTTKDPETGKKYQNIIFTRIGVKIARGRINSLGLSRFPIKPNEPTTFYTCFHNASNQTFDGSLEVELKDDTGKTLTTLSYQGKVQPAIQAVKKNLDFNYSPSVITISARIRDSQGKIVDEVNVSYDCRKFGSQICQ